MSCRQQNQQIGDRLVKLEGKLHEPQTEARLVLHSKKNPVTKKRTEDIELTSMDAVMVIMKLLNTQLSTAFSVC